MKDSLQTQHDPDTQETQVSSVTDSTDGKQSATGFLPKLYEESLFPPSPHEHKEVDFRYSGMTVNPKPYLLRNDNEVTSILLCCFLLTMMVFGRNKRYVRQQIQDFFFGHTNGNSPSVTTGSEMRYTLFLHLQAGLLTALFAFDYTLSVYDMFMTSVTHFQLLGIYVLCCWGCLGFKHILYTSINGIFFNKEERMSWIKSYSFLLSAEGILLFPLALVAVYFNLPIKTVVFSWGVLLGLIKILLFYKTFSVFLPKIYGCVHLIVYLCALEILPIFLLWKALMFINRVLI